MKRYWKGWVLIAFEVLTEAMVDVDRESVAVVVEAVDPFHQFASL